MRREDRIDTLVGTHAERLSERLQAHRSQIFLPNARKQLRKFPSGEVAALLGVEDACLRKLGLDGKGPQPETRPGGRRLYSAEDIVALRRCLEDPERYRIVYGRRRVLALRDLGMPVKAMIRDLDDREAILAQGQENSARRDLSFIERANFARQMVEAGYERKIIADALSTDRTLVSRLLLVSDAVPIELIEHIGAAPSVGRDRWISFATKWTEQELSAEDGIAMLAAHPGGSSDDRFDALHAWLEKFGRPVSPKVARPGPETRILTRPDGKRLGRIVRKSATVRIEMSRKAAEGFDTWLEAHLEELHRDWLASRDGLEQS